MPYYVVVKEHDILTKKHNSTEKESLAQIVT